jgi:hypothetical protein
MKYPTMVEYKKENVVLEIYSDVTIISCVVQGTLLTAEPLTDSTNPLIAALLHSDRQYRTLCSIKAGLGSVERTTSIATKRPITPSDLQYSVLCKKKISVSDGMEICMILLGATSCVCAAPA